jgi:P27 family predicted phage terminase small subunit
MNPDAPQSSEGVPTPPDWLNDDAVVKFQQLCGILSGMGVLSPDDTDALAMLSSRLEEIETCSKVIDDIGRTYATTNRDGEKMFRPRPEVGMKNEAMRHAQSLLCEFGLTPAARSKVSANKSAAENPFAALG